MIGKRQPRDLLASPAGLAVNWGLPILAMLGAIWLAHPAKTWVWIAALVWMGVACLANARRCGRRHCFFTGPFLLAMTVPVFLHGHGILPLGGSGWHWLGAAIGLGTVTLTLVTEGRLGRYS